MSCSCLNARVHACRATRPDEIYNLGAQSHVQVSFQLPQYTGEVDGMVGRPGHLAMQSCLHLDPPCCFGMPCAKRCAVRPLLLAPCTWCGCPQGRIFKRTCWCRG